MIKSGKVNIKRIDGDACNLSKLISNADIVYAQNVLFDLNYGNDTRKMLSHSNGGKKPSKNEVSKLEINFDEAERNVIEESCKITPNGHVVLFKKYFLNVDIDNIIKKYNKKKIDGKILYGNGRDPSYVLLEFPSNELNLYHFAPVDFNF